MIAVVIISHGPAQSAALSRFPSDTFSEAVGVVVVGPDSVAPSFPCILVYPSDVAGFNAGANRDKGLQAASETWPGCDVIFLDGDCTPSATWLYSHRAMLECDEPVVSCGMRVESGRPDPRTLPLSWQGANYAPSMGHKNLALHDIAAHRAAWSCNLGINRAAVSLLQDAGEKLHGSRRIFSPEFDGRWGGEDTALGIVAHLIGCQIVTLGEASAVDHAPHDPFNVSRINLDKIPEYADRVCEILYICDRGESVSTERNEA